MTYAARDETTLPELPPQMRWVVLVDKRQLAVLLLENEVPVASATDTLDARGDIDYENQPVDAVERLCRRLADQAVHQWGFMQGLKQKLGPGVDVRMKLVEWNR
ncbi:hypothetical protein [Mycobacterium szulgai]|uniref:Uncharacterized protein n=1 Tax=Mycobacterium szulgai TaxID=1787 RepID=A0A1X2EJB8_MYCSZ|nr:hypothetical protein [Mycobacterium szulgai]MCV7075704.1 hypothetical protein [Mycobacterium szulgai]ORX03941.1 hypothetical protein AWC27_27525 [Mycobacterium szulgai]